MDLIAKHNRQWCFWDILHDEPGRLCFFYAPLKLWNEVRSRLIAVIFNQVAQPAKSLARRAAKNAAKVSRLWVKVPNSVTPEKIRTTNDSKPLFLKRPIQ